MKTAEVVSVEVAYCIASLLGIVDKWRDLPMGPVESDDPKVVK